MVWCWIFVAFIVLFIVNRLKINITSYGEIFYYFNYQDKSYIFEKFFATKKLWDGLPVFRK